MKEVITTVFSNDIRRTHQSPGQIFFGSFLQYYTIRKKETKGEKMV